MPLTDVAYTTQAAGAQDGTAVSAAWGDTATSLSVFSGIPFPSQVGMVFTWGLTLDSQGRPLIPPIVTGLSLSMVTHSSVIADPGVDVLELWVVPEAAPVNYAITPSLMPFGRGELLISAALATWTGTPTTLTWNLGTYVTAGNGFTPTCAANLTTMRTRYWSTSRWQGRVALSLQGTLSTVWVFASAESVGETPPTLTSTQSAFHTGHNLGFGRRARARHCARSGLPVLTDQLIEDGYVRGVHVMPEWHDREDRAGLDINIPSTEGEVDDRNTGSS